MITLDITAHMLCLVLGSRGATSILSRLRPASMPLVPPPIAHPSKRNVLSILSRTRAAINGDGTPAPDPVGQLYELHNGYDIPR